MLANGDLMAVMTLCIVGVLHCLEQGIANVSQLLSIVKLLKMHCSSLAFSLISCLLEVDLLSLSVQLELFN